MEDSETEYDLILVLEQLRGLPTDCYNTKVSWVGSSGLLGGRNTA